MKSLAAPGPVTVLEATASQMFDHFFKCGWYQNWIFSCGQSQVEEISQLKCGGNTARLEMWSHAEAELLAQREANASSVVNNARSPGETCPAGGISIGRHQQILEIWWKYGISI